MGYSGLNKPRLQTKALSFYSIFVGFIWCHLGSKDINTLPNKLR